MKSILFMRHSYAEDGYDKADFDRQIRKKGYLRLDEQIERFKTQSNIKIDFAICSSAVRTTETCRYFLNKLELKIPISFERWIYEDYLSADFINFIQATNQQHDTILFIGHNPSISHIATRMSKNGIFGFKPGSILKLDFDIANWQMLDAQSGTLGFYFD